MIIDESTVFFFSNGDKYGLHGNGMQHFLNHDFSIYCKFKPDMEKINKIVEETGVYNGALIAKNGKHIGLFFNVYRSPDGSIMKKISWSFWSNVVGANKEVYDVDREVEFSFYNIQKDGLYDNNPKGIVEDRYYNIIINHNLRKKEFTMTETVSDRSKSVKYSNILDYSDAYTWVGAATLISKTHHCVFKGDIDKIHIQQSEADLQYANEFFYDYPSFIEKINKNRTSLKNIFCSDFTYKTYYKLKDMSGNGFHPVLFKPEWTED
jgi:hypothetical protein